ncbi:MAG: hypothetical protein F4228_02075 [Acidobacteria bacterium]|nr:hypothetical protein [Acidobacteriota bacterium]MXW38265.1 hypothetical protein [Acidobacteriota bacterium]MXZ60468.1 hypothetical protein [Acidobacteriota bacterium]MYA45106.1 hypothetical protein [Acidobacteriota bacterium]MYB32393.1 hypothetical protein [Acidobacteriota bacterium]
MKRVGPTRQKPLAATVLAVVLAFAVVCPLMAAPGIPAEASCHGSSESAPDAERVSACCSSVTVPKLLTPEPGPAAVLPASVEPVQVVSRWNRQPDGPLSPREPRPPLFVRHAALLI